MGVYSISKVVCKTTIAFINQYFDLNFSNKMSSKKDYENDITINDQDSPEGSCYIALLPLEVVIYLMEFLPYPDRVVARQVCQQWYRACLHPKFLDQEKLVITTETNMEALSNVSRRYFHIVIVQVDITNEIKEFLIKLATALRSLYFSKCSMYEKILIDILSSCSHLETLVLEKCQELFMPGTLLSKPEEVAVLQKSLGRLRGLHVSFNRYLSDAILIRLIDAMPYLNTISLEGCQMSYHTGLLQKYYPKNSNSKDFEFPSETVLTFWIFHSILSRRASVIKNINLSDTLVDSNALNVLSALEDLKLEELHLAGCQELSNKGVLTMSEHQKSLTVLDISSCSRITDPALQKICNNLTNLRKLAVKNCRALTDLGVVHLKKLVKLEELDISYCDNVTGEGIQEGLCHTVNRTMRKLYMNGLNAITSDTVALLAEKLPDLNLFSLNFCSHAVTDNSIQAIFQHQIHLCTLRLAGSYGITDIGLTGMGTDKEVNAVDHLAPSQPKLHISLRSKAEEDIINDAHRQKRMQEICEAQLKGTANVGYCLARLKGLRTLDLRCCNKITDASLMYAFKFLELQHLNLSQCHQITDSGLRALVKNNPSIYSLSLEECSLVTDDGIAAITSSLKRLSYLDIRYCPKLTAASVITIVNNCHRLRYFDASYCSGMMDKIKEMLPRLPHHTYFFRANDQVLSYIPQPPPYPY